MKDMNRMDRIEEMVSGNVVVVGKKNVLNNVFYHIIEQCGQGDEKTFVLCGDASPFLHTVDENVHMGINPQNKELLPDFLEPFLQSPVTGIQVENIVAALTDMFFASLAGTNTHDQYFVGTAEILFAELLKYSLMTMAKKGNFSFSSFAKFYADFEAEFSAMIAYSDRNTTTPYSYTNSDLKDWVNEKHSPFADTLIRNAPTTANNVEGTMRAHTARMREFISLVSRRSDSKSFSFIDNVEQKDNGVVFLQPGASLCTYPKLLFTFVCEGLRLLAGIFPNKKFRLVIPDIRYWRDPVTLSTLLERTPRNMSVVWGVSNIGVMEQLGKAHPNLSMSMVSMSDTQVWGSTGDATAHRIYQELIPETLRSYRLSQIPGDLCYVKSDSTDFAPVTIPEIPMSQDRMELQASTENFTDASPNPSLWMDKAQTKNNRRNKTHDKHEHNNSGNHNSHSNGGEHQSLADIIKYQEPRTQTKF